MKLAILADMHIGYERFEEDARKQAQEALDAAASMADAILIAGDIFDRRAPKPEVIAQAINLFRDLSRRQWSAKVVEFSSQSGRKPYTNVPIVAIPGTHERVAEGKENVLGLLALAGLLVDASEATAVLELGQERIAVFGLGGISEELVKGALARLAPRPVAGAFNVFMLHQSIFELLPFDESFIRYAELPKGFDLYVCGHVHSRVDAKVHGKDFIIPGSTVLTQLKDAEQEGKGFVLYDTRTLEHRFVPINSRQFVSVRLKFDGATATEVSKRASEAVEAAIAGKAGRPVVRLVLEGTVAKGVELSDIPIGRLAASYSESAEIYMDSELESPEMQRGIAELRENKLRGVSIRELGATLFRAKLKDHKFSGEGGMEPSRLFEILSSSSQKDKVIEEAMDMLDGKG